MKKPSITHRAIDSPELITVLASPLRQEIVDMLAALGGGTSIAELATHLGRHADGLYYHLNILCKAGLVSEEGNSADGERTYQIAGHTCEPLRLAYRTDSDAHKTALRKFARGMLQVAEEDFEAALESDAAVLSGPKRQLWAARNKAWLTEQELGEVNALLERLCDLMSRPRTPEREHLLSCVFVLAPHMVQSKRRGKPDALGQA